MQRRLKREEVGETKSHHKRRSKCKYEPHWANSAAEKRIGEDGRKRQMNPPQKRCANCTRCTNEKMPFSLTIAFQYVRDAGHDCFNFSILHMR